MALNFRKFLDGIRVIPKTTSTADEKGELDVTDSTGKLNYHNGTSSSPVVTEAHSATLTNKTLENAIILGNTSADALRITQTGSGNALLVEDSANPDATPFVIDASGNVGIGTASPAARLEVENGTGVRTSYNANADDLAIDGPANTGITISSANNAIGSILFADNDSDLRGAVQYTHTTNALYLSTDGSERLRIDSIGRVLVGSTSARNIGTSPVSSSIQVEGTNTNNSSILAYCNANTAPNSGIIVLGKSRGTAVGDVTAVQSGDSLGRIHFMGADGTSGGVTGAFIVGQVDGTVATNVMPGALTFWTTPASSNTPLERLRIDSLGKVGIGKAPSGAAGCVLDLGGSTTTEIRLRTTTTGTTNSDGLAIQMWDDNNVYLLNYEPASMVFGTSGTERLRIDSAGRVLIGTSASRTNPYSSASLIQVESTSSSATPSFIRNTNDATGSAVIIGKSRGTVVGSFTAVSSGDDVGSVSFEATDGTSLLEIARVRANVDGAVSTGVIPSRLTFTTTNSLGGANERMRIDSSGNVGIATNAPATTLDLNGTFAIRSSSNSQTGAVTITAPTTGLVRLTGAITAVQGVAGGANGERVTLLNKSGSTVAINHEDSSATAADRISVGGGASFNLLNNASVELAYDSTASRWNVVGSASTSTQVTSVSADTILTSLNDVVLVNASGAARTITLPTPTSGKIIRVKKTDSSANAVTISRSSTETIDGNNSVSLAAQYDSYTMVSDGTNWFII